MGSIHKAGHVLNRCSFQTLGDIQGKCQVSYASLYFLPLSKILKCESCASTVLAMGIRASFVFSIISCTFFNYRAHYYQVLVFVSPSLPLLCKWTQGQRGSGVITPGMGMR